MNGVLIEITPEELLSDVQTFNETNLIYLSNNQLLD